ncbi:MAG: HPr family phosphocarrier protein [Bacillota bacterium]
MISKRVYKIYKKYDRIPVKNWEVKTKHKKLPVDCRERIRLEYKRQVSIQNYKGIHARVAAMIVHKASQINRKYDVYMFIGRLGVEEKISATSMITLTSLNIKNGDEIILTSEGPQAKEALDEMAQYLGGQIDVEKTELDEVDMVIEHTTITSEKVFESLSNGIVVVDENNIITIFNRAAERIIGLKREQVIGQKAHEVLDDSKLHLVLASGEEIKGARQQIGNTTIITNRAPIFSGGKIIGAVAIFMDISEIEALSSELESVKDIKERFGNILEHTYDAISMIDDQGIITYVNPAYEEMWNVRREEILGKNIFSSYMDKAAVKALEIKEKQLGVTVEREDGTKVLSNATPIIVNGAMKGVVSTSKEVTELQRMVEKLKDAEEKIKYFQEELYGSQEVGKAFSKIIGRSGVLKDALHIALKASRTSATVLIRGESGTGKELLARAIHQSNGKGNKPFIRVNCAAIPENLLESELFGHEKGAFTGAIRRKPGKFELANGGTIFLDEIGDISKDMQVRLLRVLQEREFERVGGLETIKVKVRVIAATNKNLEDMVSNGLFREDLYYRLNVIPITLPPLRERKGDIPLLVEHFLEKVCQKEDIPLRDIAPQALKYLEKYDWPGNIRELENIIERALALAEGKEIRDIDLPGYIRSRGNMKMGSLINLINDDVVSMEEYEKQIIQRALEKHKSFNSAAKALGITHRTVAMKARKYGLR